MKAQFLIPMLMTLTLECTDAFIKNVENYGVLSLKPKISVSVLRHSDYEVRTTTSALSSMKRPFLDRIASTLFNLETKRVEESSEIDSKGRYGEPMEWSESTSMANTLSKAVASNPLGYQFKQFVADIIAGEFDEESVKKEVDSFIQSDRITVFSFTTCPFCRRAKDYFEDNGIAYTALELDELEGNKGNEIRAVLGKLTKRTSVPSIFVNGNFIGGCNDGPGLFPLVESGEFEKLFVEK